MVKAGYKLTEVGVIPDDWETEEIGAFSKVITGPFGTLLKASEYSTEGVPLLSVGEIRDGYFHITDKTPRISDEVKKRLPQYVLRDGDIVFGRKGGVDRSSEITGEEAGWFLGSDGMAVRTTSGANPKYLAHQFRSSRVQAWLLRHAIGTTMPSLNQDILSRTKVPIPIDSEEQKTIAGALSDVDGLIAGLEALIAKKRSLKTATMQQLLTGKTRLPGFDHDSWKSIKFTDCVSFQKGKGISKASLNNKGEGKSCVHYGELFTVYGAIIHRVRSSTSDTANLVLSVANDVLMPTSDVTPRGLAKACCIKESGIALGGDILTIHPSPDDLDGGFLAYLLRSMEKQILDLVTGSTVYHLYAKDIAGLCTTVPLISEQRAIVDVLEDMEREIDGVVGRLAKTKALKQGMMQELLTGRTRLI